MAIASTPGLGTKEEAWPALSFMEWKDTLATLHRYTQVLGKVRLALTPPENHWWNVSFRVTSRGLSTMLIPYGNGSFEVDFDFLANELRFLTSRGDVRVMELTARPVAEFYRDVMATLRSLGIEVSIWDRPVEIPDDTTRFSEDEHHSIYVPEQARRFWRALLQANIVLKEFRARFTGKCSPVQFFWGSFDLAVTRFGGRPAPVRPGADAVTAEAYCEEVCSAGFWPGTEALGGASFYCYAAPEPPGFSSAQVEPASGGYSQDLKEFLLPYEAVRRASNPRAFLLDFLQTTYDACADLGKWDRDRLERPLILPDSVKASHSVSPEGSPAGASP
ncbi:DUF5996 family protein [Myxococcus landrumensis]|uniref:Ava_C0101 and related proteins n=1 Tax=Myxococcus landrumensis TaxID=2813577 RepID=A0ABX7NDC2_9BACT|nr:DUF5996 family protein [Myxococcus landrumus]QSQ16817.1 hypothetical protein JY572_12520 [Myxococcus landrumus]